MKNFSATKRLVLPALFLASLGCSHSATPVPGPDKQFSGTAQGALTGAGAGAATGFQVAAGTGPGALVGAGLGAIAGGIQGVMEDSAEESMLGIQSQTAAERQRAEVQGILQEHFKKRLKLHPTRDIYPADLFFQGDASKISRKGEAIVQELALMNKNRLPWSRLVVATYVKSAGETNSFAEHLAKRRAIQLGDAFIKYGIEPRRIETRPIIMSAPVLIDPDERPSRYNQAVEFIAVDQ